MLSLDIKLRNPSWRRSILFCLIAFNNSRYICKNHFHGQQQRNSVIVILNRMPHIDKSKIKMVFPIHQISLIFVFSIKHLKRMILQAIYFIFWLCINDINDLSMISLLRIYFDCYLFAAKIQKSQTNTI